MLAIRFSITVLLLNLLLAGCVFGKKAAEFTILDNSHFPGQVKASTSGLTYFQIAPSAQCNDNFARANVGWSPSGGSSGAIITFIGQDGSFASFNESDNGGASIAVSGYLSATYYQVTIATSNGNATSAFIFADCTSILTAPTSASTLYTNSTDVHVQWNPLPFTSANSTNLNITFINQVFQSNYTFTNIPNNGSIHLNISGLNIPASDYKIFVLGYDNNNSTKILSAEYSQIFGIQHSTPPPPPPITSVSPGVYVTNVTNSLSSGNSSDYIVYSSTGLNVTVNNSDVILPSSDLLVAWTPAANLSNYNATLVLVDISNPSHTFNPVNVSDLGSASVNVSLFGNPLPGLYELVVDGTLGSGVSLPFPIASAFPLNVTLSSNSSAANSTITASWTPFSTLVNATVSILRLSNGTLIPVASNITDNGSLSIQLNYGPGAYLVVVNTPIGNGSSSILEITAPLSISASPSNISSASESTNVTWTPFDTYQTNVSLIVYNGSNVVSNTSIPNTGSYPLTLSSTPGLYNVTIVTNIGSGSANLTVYSSTGLSVTSLNASSLVYTNTTNAPFAWSPSDPSTGNVTITLTNLNTNQTFNVTVPNTGSASVNISALDLPPSSYQATINSALGSGSSSDFVIKSPLALVVIQPNASTNVSDVGQLDVTWTPSNPAGFNATITLFDLSYPPTTYQFSSVDNGNSTINLDTQVVNKDLFTTFASQVNPLAAKGTLNRRQIVKV